MEELESFNFELVKDLLRIERHSSIPQEVNLFINIGLFLLITGLTFWKRKSFLSNPILGGYWGIIIIQLIGLCILDFSSELLSIYIIFNLVFFIQLAFYKPHSRIVSVIMHKLEFSNLLKWMKNIFTNNRVFFIFLTVLECLRLGYRLISGRVFVENFNELRGSGQYDSIAEFLIDPTNILGYLICPVCTYLFYEAFFNKNSTKLLKGFIILLANVYVVLLGVSSANKGTALFYLICLYLPLLFIFKKMYRLLGIIVVIGLGITYFVTTIFTKNANFLYNIQFIGARIFLLQIDGLISTYNFHIHEYDLMKGEILRFLSRFHLTDKVPLPPEVVRFSLYGINNIRGNGDIGFALAMTPVGIGIYDFGILFGFINVFLINAYVLLMNTFFENLVDSKYLVSLAIFFPVINEVVAFASARGIIILQIERTLMHIICPLILWGIVNLFSGYITNNPEL